MDYTIALSEVADDPLRKAIAAPLLQYNESLAGPSQHRALVLVIRDSSDAVIGGLWGATGYGWLYTQMLTVPQSLRGQGVGTRLMQLAEEEAARRGCHHAWVDTQFGARPFYERLGYGVFGELPDYPPGFSRTFLKKALPALAAP
jgi:GNAT superfamily N-acetyltransferase